MRNYCIIEKKDIPKLNFEEIIETSADTLFYNNLKTKTIVKYNGEMPPCLKQLDNLEGPYSYEQIISIIRTNEWQPEE